jgi:hypothetical protein
MLLVGSTAAASAQAEEHPDVKIDFERCVPIRKVVGFAFGSTTYEIAGMENGKCVMRYGTEIENPVWDGFLDKTCKVPVEVGEQSFKVGEGGVDFTSLKSYCEPTPRPEKKKSNKRRFTLHNKQTSRTNATSGSLLLSQTSQITE